MLVLNVVLVSDDKHVKLCDKLEEPFPRKILKIVEILNTKSCIADEETFGPFSILYEEKSEIPSIAPINFASFRFLNPFLAAEIPKKLKFDDSSLETPTTTRKVLRQRQINNATTSSKTSNQNQLQVPEPRKPTPSSPKVFNLKTTPTVARRLNQSASTLKHLDRQRSVSPLATRTGFATCRKSSTAAGGDNLMNSPVSNRGSPLSKLSSSPLVQFKVIIVNYFKYFVNLKPLLSSENCEKRTTKSSGSRNYWSNGITQMTV